MRTRIFAAALLAVLAIALGACTQNNGHIGRLFGSWVLVQRTVNGTADPLAADSEAYLSFQSGVVRMLTITESYNVEEENYASWTETGDRLVLNFDNHEDADTPWVYAVVSWLKPAAPKISFTITHLDGGRLELLRQEDDDIYVYSFQKTW